MIAMDLQQAANVLSAELRVGSQAGDSRFEGVSTDTRTLEPRQLFVALGGEHFDGHAFLPEAENRGAAGALVQQWVECGLTQLRCGDTQAAMGALARDWRRRHDCRVIGITGSNGKTTVKTMLHGILERGATCLVTPGNYNNEIGLPLTLFKLSSEHQFAVIEMGAAAPGDIDYLARIAEPEVGIVNNAGPAHLEGMGSVAGVARTKGELFAALPDSGTAVINADDDHCSLWRGLAGGSRILTFGLDNPADVSARWHSTDDGMELELMTPAGGATASLSCFGEHNVRNAVAAAACAVALDRPLEEIVAGLKAFRPIAGRLLPRTMPGGWRLLEDTYNANPASLSAGIRVLASMPGEKWLVLGDMKELGEDADALHFQAGSEAHRMGVSRLFCLGPRSHHAALAFGDNAEHFDSAETLAAALAGAIHPGVVCLIKGSRGMAMENVVAALESLLPGEDR